MGHSPIAEPRRRLVQAARPAHELLDRARGKEVARCGARIDVQILRTANHAAVAQVLDRALVARWRPTREACHAAEWPARAPRHCGKAGHEPRRAYVVLHAEPEFDCANPVAARAALEKAEFVVVMSPFRHGMHYADALLPIGPFTETAGTFVNCEGRAASRSTASSSRSARRARRGRCCACWGRCSACRGSSSRSIDDVRDVAADGRRHRGERSRNDTRRRDREAGRADAPARARRRRSDPFRRPARAPRAGAAADRRREAAAARG